MICSHSQVPEAPCPTCMGAVCSNVEGGEGQGAAQGRAEEESGCLATRLPAQELWSGPT